MSGSLLAVYLAVLTAATLIIMGAGLVYLLRQKQQLLARALDEKCRTEGVPVVAGPAAGVLTGPAGRRRGVACLTAYEFIFIPLRDRKVLQIPAERLDLKEITEGFTFVFEDQTYSLQVTDLSAWGDRLKG